jgi:hypothetical protein
MKNKLSKIVIAVIGLTIGVSVAFAASVHFKKTPTFTDNGTTLTTCFSLAGLGNQDVTISISTTGEATTTCTNPAGEVAPGINKQDLGGSVSQTFKANEIKNGTLTACVTTANPTITSKEAGSPNNNWTAAITDVEFDSATVTVTQGGQIVLQQTF